jgi:hypothetical protein
MPLVDISSDEPSPSWVEASGARADEKQGQAGPGPLTVDIRRLWVESHVAVIEEIGSTGLGVTLALSLTTGRLAWPRAGLSLVVGAALLGTEAWLVSTPAAAAAAVVGVVAGVGCRAAAASLLRHRVEGRRV